MNEVLEVECSLPFARANWTERTWMGLQLRGMLHAAGVTRTEVRMDLQKVGGAFKDHKIRKVSLFSGRLPSAGLSVGCWSAALTKAVEELCETIAWSSFPRSSCETRSGWAAGADRDLAIRAAYAELIERDSLITHLLCPSVRSIPVAPPQGCSLDAHCVQLWSADPSIAVVLAGLRQHRDKPWFLGAAAGIDIASAAAKAYLEAVMILCGYANARLISVSPASRHYQALQHIHSSEKPEVARVIEAIFSGGGSATPQFKANSQGIVVEFFKQFGRVASVVHVQYPQLCPLSWGELWEQAKELIQGILRKRSLDPGWLKHPFA